jgi:hypothetical protein
VEHGPVYVAGQERSGTSLMYALLASHPDIAMMRRTNLWMYFHERYGDLRDPVARERCLATLLRYRRIIVLELDETRLRADFAAGEPTYERLFWLVGQQVADRQGKPRWGDKSLHTERYADDIFRAYPDARILHMVRDPRDRYASVLTRWKVRRGDVGAGTAAWLASVKLGERHVARYPDRYRIVRYESLVRDPRGTLSEVCAFLGTVADERMLAMGGAADFRAQGGNSSYGSHEVGVISAASIGRYREVLTPRQITFIDRAAARPMQRMAYPDSGIELDERDQLRFVLGDGPVNTGALVAWRARASLLHRLGHRIPERRLVPEVP